MQLCFFLNEGRDQRNCMFCSDAIYHKLCFCPLLTKSNNKRRVPCCCLAAPLLKTHYASAQDHSPASLYFARCGYWLSSDYLYCTTGPFVGTERANLRLCSVWTRCHSASSYAHCACRASTKKKRAKETKASNKAKLLRRFHPALRRKRRVCQAS